jgi:hypothetical protein
MGSSFACTPERSWLWHSQAPDERAPKLQEKHNQLAPQTQAAFSMPSNVIWTSHAEKPQRCNSPLGAWRNRHPASGPLGRQCWVASCRPLAAWEEELCKTSQLPSFRNPPSASSSVLCIKPFAPLCAHLCMACSQMGSFITPASTRNLTYRTRSVLRFDIALVLPLLARQGSAPRSCQECALWEGWQKQQALQTVALPI